MTDAYIGIGSNVGDRGAHMVAARDALANLPGTQLTGQSRVYETDPVGPVDQGAFLNAAVRVATALDPRQLLASMLDIEREAGRERRERWGPRTLDLDLLLYGEEVVTADELTVPHPLMHERPFVLRPLCDIDPDVVHPVIGMRVEGLLDALAAPPAPLCDVRGW